MFWTMEKLEQRIREIADYRYSERMELDGWTFATDKERMIGAYPPNLPPERRIGKGDRWEGRDLYVWLGKKIAVPAEWKGRRVCGLFDFGKTGAGHNSGFESLLFVNGKPYQGVDSNHKEVFFGDEQAGREMELVFRLWSGLEGGGKPAVQEHKFREASLAVLNEPTDRLYYTGKAVLDTVKIMGEERPERQELLQALDRAFRLLDWSDPGSPDFYRSAEAAEESLRQALERMQGPLPVTIRCIGHTHIDVAWLWRLSHTREKAARSFSTVLRLMEQYPEYIFLQSQPQLYAYIKQDYPEIYEQIKQRVKEGRWEAGGAMWLEADCNLTSGESLVRQILYGTRFFRDEFQVECEYLWLPDVFGYSWALPQILIKSGIRAFMTTKISWNQYNRMPHDTFLWRGIDGTEVLTHFVTTPEVPDSKVWWYTYNGTTDPFAVKGIWDTYRDKGINQELLLSYGYGDGGGGANRDMLEMRRRLEAMPGMPRAVAGRADVFFDKLRQTVESTDQYVHTWDGELYLEYHRGTYTSQAFVKRMNRKLELLYRKAEWLQSLRAAVGGSWEHYPADALSDGWRIILRNQFHDIIPGSSIPEVYEDVKVEYGEAERIGKEGVSSAMDGLAAAAQPETEMFTVYNGASFDRSDWVDISLGEAGACGSWTDIQGNRLTAQKVGSAWRVRLERIPALGSAAVRFRSGAGDESDSPESVPFQMSDSGITTPFYELAWNGHGQLTSIFDRLANREVLAEGERGNVLQVFEDKPKMFDAWDIDIFYQEKMLEVRDLQSVEWVAAGPLQATARFIWRYRSSAIVQDLTVYAHSRRIDFATKVEWNEKQQLLKAAFPVSVRSTEAAFDIQFGNVKRPTHWNTSWDYARFETVGHQWADLSERGYGVSLLNDCKYGHDIKDNVIRLSLIKSATYPDPGADQGEHEFTYALFPHEGDWADAGTAQEAWQLNDPLVYLPGRSPSNGKSLFRVDRANVMVDAVKKAEDADAAIIRLHENAGARGEIRLSSDYDVASWQECDLMERPIAEERPVQDLRFSIKPYEIKTFLVKWK